MNERIKELRNELELTQMQFAEKLNLSQNFIAQIESGKKNMSSRTILDVCRIFNVNNEWLTEGTGDIFVAPMDDRMDYISTLLEDCEPEKSEMIRNIMINYFKLDESDQKIINDLVNILYNRRKKDRD